MARRVAYMDRLNALATKRRPFWVKCPVRLSISCFCAAHAGAKVSPKDQGEVKGILKELGYSKDQVFKF